MRAMARDADEPTSSRRRTAARAGPGPAGGERPRLGLERAVEGEAWTTRDPATADPVVRSLHLACKPLVCGRTPSGQRADARHARTRVARTSCVKPLRCWRFFPIERGQLGGSWARISSSSGKRFSFCLEKISSPSTTTSNWPVLPGSILVSTPVAFLIAAARPAAFGL